jgi:hypothetical protein
MASTVTPIATVRRTAHREPFNSADALLALPFAGDSMFDLQTALEEENLQSDVPGLWLGYPNLKEAAEKLLKLLSSKWLSHGQAENSAVVAAILRGVKRVKEGLGHEENSQDAIVVNFYEGLGTIADDVAGVYAWGYEKARPVEQYDDSKGAFTTWAHGNSFTDIRFFFRPKTSRKDVDGTRWKLLCAVAPTRDVGIVSRFK